MLVLVCWVLLQSHHLPVDWLKPDNTTHLISDLRNFQLERHHHCMLKNELRVLILQHADFQWPPVLILKSHLHDSMTQTFTSASPQWRHSFRQATGSPTQRSSLGLQLCWPSCPWVPLKMTVCVACACVYMFHVPLCVSEYKKVWECCRRCLCEDDSGYNGAAQCF